VKAALLDSGVIVGLSDRNEAHHDRCVTALEGLEGPLVTSEAVIAESCYLLRGLPGAVDAVLQISSAESFKSRFSFRARPSSFAA